MKKIFCYGDSNTYGYNPEDGSRFDETTRWTGLLQTQLGVEHVVTNDGVCDRTGFVNNPKGLLYSAQRHLPKMLTEIEEVNIFILAVGTNDLQSEYNINFDVVDKSYISLEGVGVTPDIECVFDANALQNGHDNQLERALQYVRTGK